MFRHASSEVTVSFRIDWVTTKSLKIQDKYLINNNNDRSWKKKQVAYEKMQTYKDKTFRC